MKLLAVLCAKLYESKNKILGINKSLLNSFNNNIKAKAHKLHEDTYEQLL